MHDLSPMHTWQGNSDDPCYDIQCSMQECPLHEGTGQEGTRKEETAFLVPCCVLPAIPAVTPDAGNALTGPVGSSEGSAPTTDDGSCNSTLSSRQQGPSACRNPVSAIELDREERKVSVENEPKELPANPHRLRKILHQCIGEKNLRLLTSMGALEEIEELLLPITTDDGDYADHLLPMDTWVDSEIEITLDSGCCEHVLDISDAPGYSAFITESSGSRRHQNFIVGNGEKVPNEGEISLNMESSGAKNVMNSIRSTFQIAEVTRPLMSVGRVCDQGLQCLFTKVDARVTDLEGGLVCLFHRVGGLYVANMKLKAPSQSSEPFVRPDQ